MKQLTAVLLCLLLLGCARQVPTAPPETTVQTEALSAVGLYAPDHPMETVYPGLVRAYPLTQRKVQGIRALGNDVLVFSGYGSTTLTLFTGENLLEKASLTLDFSLQQDSPSLQIHENGISFFDPQQQATIVLDRQLEALRHIALPDGVSGQPILSYDQSTLYYCTGWAVMAWDLDTGIRRTVKELFYERQELTALHMDGQILECTILDNGLTTKLLLSERQGVELWTLPENGALTACNERYYAVAPSGYQQLQLFGNADSSPRLLLPKETWQKQFYLPEDHAVVTVSASNGSVHLDYYELNTGILRSSVSLRELQIPKNIINTKGHAVYILVYDPEADCDLLYRWDVLRQPPDPENTTTYTMDYRGPENPDVEALNACQAKADAIGEKYGITLRVWEEATTVQPWDYRFEPEFLAPILDQELNLLDERLSQYPESILQQTKAHFTEITLCLVRQITGTGEESSLRSATGIQFFQDNKAYVVITTGKYSQQALYHELYHVMETHILTESTALDQWETMNPAGFVYGSNHAEDDIYLQGQTRAFVDRYSMGSVKEDRARILENAMLEQNNGLFQSEYMQRKLMAICTGIRESYRLKKYPKMLPWEQYLINSLVPAE